MLELLYPVVLAALLLLLSKIVKRIVAKVKTPVEYSSPPISFGSERSAREVDDNGSGGHRSVDIDDSDRNGGFGGGGEPGGGSGDPEVMLTPRNLLQQQSSVVDPAPIVSGVPRPPPRSRTSSNNSVLDEINDFTMVSRTALELARISNLVVAVIDAAIKAVIHAVLAIAAALTLRKAQQSKDDVIRSNGRCALPTISGCLETCELHAVTVC